MIQEQVKLKSNRIELEEGRLSKDEFIALSKQYNEVVNNGKLPNYNYQEVLKMTYDQVKNNIFRRSAVIVAIRDEYRRRVKELVDKINEQSILLKYERRDTIIIIFETSIEYDIKRHSIRIDDGDTYKQLRLNEKKMLISLGFELRSECSYLFDSISLSAEDRLKKSEILSNKYQNVIVNKA